METEQTFYDSQGDVLVPLSIRIRELALSDDCDKLIQWLSVLQCLSDCIAGLTDDNS